MKSIQRAFTLIELLVVIAIIAILAAILFPVFAQAKTAAKKTAAISGMKQMNLAVIMYANDQEDRYPMGSGACWWTPTDGGWVYDTQPYVKSLELLRDSTDPKPKTGWPSWMLTNANGINISYVSNGMIGWNGSSNQVLGVMGIDQSVPKDSVRSCGYGPWMSSGTTTAGQVTKPTDTIMFTERFGSSPPWGPSAVISGDAPSWDSTGFANKLPDGSRNGTPYTFTANGAKVTANLDNRNGAVSVPFNGVAVFAMADGSAKAMNPIKTNPDEKKRPADNMWNAYRADQ